MSLLLLLKDAEETKTDPVLTGAAEQLGQASAVLNGIVSPGGLDTKYWFELSEGMHPPLPPAPGIAHDAVTESSLFAAGETEVSFEHAGGSDARAALVFIWHFDANVSGASAISYGGVPMELQTDAVRGTSPWPGVQIWFADDVPAGSQEVTIAKHTSVRLRAIAETVTAQGEVVVGDSDGGSGSNAEPAVPALEAATSGLIFGIVGGQWADLPTGRADDLLSQRDEGSQAYDLQIGEVGAGSQVANWAFSTIADNARAGIVLLDPDPPGPPEEFASGFESGDFSDFIHVQSLPGRATVDEETASEGRYSARLEVQVGDEEPDTGAQRSEPISGLEYLEGYRRFFSFDFLIESHDPGHWMLIHQVHDTGSGGSPPEALFLWHDEEENPILLLQNGTGSPQFWQAPRPALGEWSRIVYGVSFGEDTGTVGPVFLNGDRMTMLSGDDVSAPANTIGLSPAYDKGPGIYRSDESTGTAVIRGDNYRVLKTFDATLPETTGATEGEVEVSASIDGLKPGTDYYFRLFAKNDLGLFVGEDVGFRTAGRSRVAVTREFPPDRLAVRIADPRTGQTIARWAEDEGRPENTIAGITKSGEMPGGHKESGGSLARDPRVDWSDTQTYFDYYLEQPGGENVFEGRINGVPESDGDRMVLEPKAVGHQVALTDRTALRMGFINGDLSKWGEPSTQRKREIDSFYQTQSAEISTGWQDTGEEPPSITIRISFENGHPLGELWFSGDGVRLGALGYDFGNISGALAGTHDIARLNTADYGGWTVSGTDHGTTSAAQQWLTTTDPNVKYAVLQTFYEGEYAAAGTDSKAWSNLRVLSYIAAQNLALQGTWPNVGYTAKQILELAVPLYTYLEAHDEDLEDDGDVIQQAWYSDEGDMATVVKDVLKYGVLRWFILNGKRFELRAPGTFGRNWQAYAGPSELKEAGLDGTRLWSKLVVSYQDVDGSKRRVGYLGSGADTESAALEITDPDHPAVKAERPREDLLSLNGISVPERALEAGERWLREGNELSHAGEATLRGYIQDDCAVFRPVSQIQPGDRIRFPDAGSGGTDYREVVEVNYDHDSRTATVQLDAPSKAVQALLERYGASLGPLALS